MAVVRASAGRQAVTHYCVEAMLAAASSASCGCGSKPGEPIKSACTWPTPVIRCSAMPSYGAGFATRQAKLSDTAPQALLSLGRQALHAATLGFEHPVTGEKLRFESEPSADLRRLIIELGRS